MGFITKEEKAMSTWRGKPYLALLAHKEEDRFTEYLCQLLQSEEVLIPFLRDLCTVETPVISSKLSVKTQVTVAGGRPDLTIRGDNIYLLFEAKVASWLHDNQVIPYVKALLSWKEKHPEAVTNLYLVSPARSGVDMLEIGRSFLTSIEPISLEIHLITWESIASLFNTISQSSKVSDPRLVFYLNEFVELVTHRLGEAERPYTAEEVKLLYDTSVGRIIMRASTIVQKTGRTLFRNATDQFDIKDSTGPDFDGYNIRSTNRKWWFGVWISVWANLGEGPIFLQLPGFSGRALPDIPSELPGPMEYKAATSTGFVVPLRIRAQIQLDQLAEEHANIIRRYYLEFPESGFLESLNK